jgi:hypothetical protein
MAPFFLYAFPWTPYKIGFVTAADLGPKPQDYYGGFLGLRAILSAANILDIFIALGKGIAAKLGKGNRTDYARPLPSYYPQNEYGAMHSRTPSEEAFVMTRGGQRGIVENE